MIFRDLILLIALLTSVAQVAPLNSLTPGVVCEPCADGAFAQKAALDPSGFDSFYKLSLPKPVQDKNFYLLSLFQRDRKLRKLLSQNQVLKQLASDKSLALKKAESCDSVDCFDELIRFDAQAIEAVANELRALTNQPDFKLLAKKDLRPSGAFIKYSQQPDAQMLVAAWKDAAAGLNRILSVYCLGKTPRYPAIDKVSFDVSTAAFRDRLKAKTAEINFHKRRCSLNRRLTSLSNCWKSIDVMRPRVTNRWKQERTKLPFRI
jgi:hypothetical protein